MTGAAPTALTIARHERLVVGAFVVTFPEPLGARPSPEWLVAMLRGGVSGPVVPDDALRGAVRDMLRGDGYKPTGRGKPASEYLVRASAEGALASINTIVDACNAVSLATGLPISVVDLDRAHPPLHVAVAPAGATYAFNASGQVIDVSGLPCLLDAEGPCANAVKDAQRTKTGAETRRILCLVWGPRALGDATDRVVAWFRALCERAGGQTSPAQTLDG